MRPLTEMTLEAADVRRVFALRKKHDVPERPRGNVCSRRRPLALHLQEAAGWRIHASVCLGTAHDDDRLARLTMRSAVIIGVALALTTLPARVGCELGTDVFGSHKQAVMRSLGLGCP